MNKEIIQIDKDLLSWSGHADPDIPEVNSRCASGVRLGLRMLSEREHHRIAFIDQ